VERRALRTLSRIGINQSFRSRLPGLWARERRLNRPISECNSAISTIRRPVVRTSYTTSRLNSALDIRRGHHRLSPTRTSSHSETVLPPRKPRVPVRRAWRNDRTVAFSDRLTRLGRLLTQKPQRVLECPLLRYAKWRRDLAPRFSAWPGDHRLDATVPSDVPDANCVGEPS
jgi:hypothetical protein